jgi:hypothetical protein
MKNNIGDLKFNNLYGVMETFAELWIAGAFRSWRRCKCARLQSKLYSWSVQN